MAGRLMAPSPGGTDWAGGLLCEPGFGHGLGVYGGHLSSALDLKKPQHEGVQLLERAVASSKPGASEDQDQDQRRSSRGRNVKPSSSLKADRDRIPKSKLDIDRSSKCRREHAFDAKWLQASVIFEEVRTKTEEDAHRARLAVRDTTIEWKKLNHRHILQLGGYCDEDTPAFVYERTSSQTLSEFVRDHPDMLWPKLRELIIAALFLKKRGLVVDVVTPEDILIGLDKMVKVAGFHRLLALRVDSGAVREAHEVCQFIAPERVGIRDAPPTLEAFVFSLGMCVVDALRAVDGVSSVNYDGEQREIVERMCHADPSERAPLSEVFSAFERFAASVRESTVEPEPLLERSVTTAGGARVDEQPQQQLGDSGEEDTALQTCTNVPTNASPQIPAPHECVDENLKIQNAHALQTSEAAGLVPLMTTHERDDLDSVRDLDHATGIRHSIHFIEDGDDVDDAEDGGPISLALAGGIGLWDLTANCSTSSSWFISPLEIEVPRHTKLADVEDEGMARWLDTDVAIKFLPATPKEAVQAEAALWHRLRHPNLLTLYGACDVGRQFFVSEPAANGQLVDYLDACEPDRRTMWKLLHQIALALKFLHRRGVVHGSVCVDNIVVTSDGQAKLIGFGRGRSAVDQATDDKSPRQLVDGEATFAADVLSFGRCIAEVVTRTLGLEAKDSWSCLPENARSLVSRMCHPDLSWRPKIEQVVRTLSQLASDESGVHSSTEEDPESLLDTGKHHGNSTAMTVPSISNGIKLDPPEVANVMPESDGERPEDSCAMQLFEPSAGHRLVDEALGSLPEWFIPRDEVEISRHSLGSGGFGQLYRGKWLSSEVVVKVVTAVTEQDDAGALVQKGVEPDRWQDRFTREADLWSRLNHPNVVKMYGANHVGDQFFVCEYASQGSLDKYLQQRPDDTWKMLYEAALGLQYLHERSVVHGDLMCDNIVVGSDGRAKLADFGLSFVATEDKVPVSANRSKARVRWKAPECLQTTSTSPSFASDIYSLGMCILEAATSDMPWMEENVDLETDAIRQLARPSMLTDGQWALVERMCRTDPRERLRIGTVVQELAKLASTTGRDDISLEGDSDRLKASAALSRMRQEVSHQDPAETDSNRGCLFQVAGMLCTRFEDVFARVPDDPATARAFRKLVESAWEGTSELSDYTDIPDAFPEAATRAFALHRRLDNFIDANQLRAEGDGGGCHNWGAPCLALWQSHSATSWSPDWSSSASSSLRVPQRV